MADTPFRLGGIEFADFEIPDRLPFGGEQATTVYKLIGGKRVVQPMGRDDSPLDWSGEFLGAQALTRARAVDRMRIAGKAVELSWSELRFKVVVQRFVADFEKPYQLPYSISCLVVEDLAAPNAADLGSGVDSMIGADLAQAKGLGGLIGDSHLSGLLGGLDKAVAGVSRFADATRTTLNSVLGPLSDVQTRAGDLIASVTGTLGTVTSLGGIAPGNPVAAMAARLASQAVGMAQLPNLYDLDSVLGRMRTNLSAVGESGARVVLAGGDLYRVAADEYGDAQGWATIAAANGLTDPILEGVQTIRVPPTINDTGGVLQP